MSSIVSSFSQAGTSYFQGHAERSIHRRNMLMTEYEGQMAEEATKKETKQLLGKQRALYAKAGVDISSGSPLLIMSETAAEGKLKEKRIRWGTEETKKLYDYYAHLAHMGGNIGATTGAVSGVINLATTIGSAVMGGVSGVGGMGGGGGGSGGWGSFLSSSMRPNYGLAG